MIKSLIAELFGTYVPIMYFDADGNSIIPAGLAGVDLVFCAGVLLFAITFYCVFRLIGAILND